MKLWVGETISVFGSRLSHTAIQFGILAALASFPFLILGLPDGV